MFPQLENLAGLEVIVECTTRLRTFHSQIFGRTFEKLP